MALPRALERICGIQAQYAPSMYVGLWTRLEGFRRDHLTRALERRTVVQGTLMRTTIHLVSAGDYWSMALAVRDARRQWWLKSAQEKADTRDLAATARKVRRRLAEGPMRHAEIEELAGRGASRVVGVGLWIDLVRVPPSGTWDRRRADQYAAARDWLGPTEVSVEEGLEFLVRRYLGGFGPATRQDVASFAGLPVREIAPVLERLELRRFRGEDGQELIDLPRAPLPDPETPAPVRFLPTWDSTLLAHARRTGILPEPYRARVFNTRNPQSLSTFLVDGVVAGSWRYENGRVRIDPFEPLDPAVRRDLAEEAERLTEFHA